MVDHIFMTDNLFKRIISKDMKIFCDDNNTPVTDHKALEITLKFD
jgi:hypothetical protein